MPTKYELQTELRELNRGFPRIPISKMKYHELEAMIDSIKKVKGEALNILPTKTPAHGGHYPPRPIPVEGVEDDGVVIKTPKAPPARKVKPEKKVKEPPTIKITFDDEEEEKDVKVVTVDKPTKKKEVIQIPASPISPPPRGKSEKVTVHFCNCPNCKL